MTIARRYATGRSSAIVCGSNGLSRYALSRSFRSPSASSSFSRSADIRVRSCSPAIASRCAAVVPAPRAVTAAATFLCVSAVVSVACAVSSVSLGRFPVLCERRRQVPQRRDDRGEDLLEAPTATFTRELLQIGVEAVGERAGVDAEERQEVPVRADVRGIEDVLVPLLGLLEALRAVERLRDEERRVEEDLPVVRAVGAAEVQVRPGGQPPGVHHRLAHPDRTDGIRVGADQGPRRSPGCPGPAVPAPRRTAAGGSVRPRCRWSAGGPRTAATATRTAAVPRRSCRTCSSRRR